MSRTNGSGSKVLAGFAALAIAAGTISAVAFSGSASAATEAPGVTAAKKVVSYLSTPPKAIPITVPLSKRPPTGIKVFMVHAASADATRIESGFLAGTKVLGWSGQALTYASNPADSVGLVSKAIQQGANYIYIMGVDTKIAQPAIDAAKAAGIPVFMSTSDGTPAGPANNIYSGVSRSSEYVQRGIVAADAVTANSNGKAKTLLFTVPQFGIFQIYEQGFRDEYAKNCVGCTLDVFGAPYGDVLSGKASSGVMAYLRTHPEINQIACVNGTWCLDFPSKAATAGINISPTGVGFSLSGTNVANEPQIVSGIIQSSIAVPLEYSGWQVVDAMARYSVKDSLVPNWTARLPLFMWTPKNMTLTSPMYAGPANYTGAFKKLWKRG